MSTQIVQHKSRDFDVVLNFPETENTLSWSFTAENDGEIYTIDSVNVASYQIAGAPVTLPYAVEAGASYSVSIVKQVNGQMASVALKTRRAINKLLALSVPDFAYHANGYMYSLINYNTVVVRDATKLTSANYIGAGTWNIDPIVAAISLPTNSNTIRWHVCHYYNDDVIIWGRLTNETISSPLFLCRIKPDFKVFDYFNTTENNYYQSSSNFYNTNTNLRPLAVGVDYVNNRFCYIQTASAGAVDGYVFNSQDLTFITSATIVSNSTFNIDFNPISDTFPLYGDVKSTTARYVNFLYRNNLWASSAVSISSGATVKANANTYSNFVLYNIFGEILAARNASGNGEAGNGQPGRVLSNKKNNWILSMSNNQSSFALTNLSGINITRLITSFVGTGLGSRYICSDERSTTFFATLSKTGFLDKILVIDPVDPNVEIGYIDENFDVNCICCNNY